MDNIKEILNNVDNLLDQEEYKKASSYIKETIKNIKSTSSESYIDNLVDNLK